MRQMTMQHVWMEGHRVERQDAASQTAGHGRLLWKYGWGLLFVILMTLLSVFGPRTVYSKLADAPVASQPAVHSVK